MTCEHIHDSGPYVLGALSPDDREAYERHLDTCPACRAEITDLAGLPMLLGRLDLATAKAVAAGGEAALHAIMAAPPAGEELASTGADRRAGPSAVPAENVLPPRLLDGARARRTKERNRHRWQVASAALVAACLAVVAVFGLRAAGIGAPATPDYTAMRSLVADSPVTARVAVDRVPDGAEIHMQCEYQGTKGPRTQRWLFKLVAVPKSGAPAELNQWTAGYEDQAQLVGHTALKPEDIQRIELRRGDDTPVLVYDMT
jgi:anti-sigma factor RsiW